MSAPEFKIDTSTGVDLQLPLAGAGGRSYAFILDWHIRIILAVAWYVIASLLFNGRVSLATPLGPSPRWFAVVLAPALALYLLYHPVLEIAMRGRTPGKRLAGVRIVTRAGASPGVGALLMRNVFRLVDGFPGMYVVGLTCTLLTRNHLRLGDLAAGTLLVYERAELLPLDPGASAGRGAPGSDPQLRELAAELLERWAALEERSRLRLARELLARARGGTDAGTDAGASAVAGDDATRLRGAVGRLAAGAA